jgi:hypothetical protein
MSLRHCAGGGVTINGSGQAFGMAVRGPCGRTLIIPAVTIDQIAAQLGTSR